MLRPRTPPTTPRRPSSHCRHVSVRTSSSAWPTTRARRGRRARRFPRPRARVPRRWLRPHRQRVAPLIRERPDHRAFGRPGPTVVVEPARRLVCSLMPGNPLTDPNWASDTTTRWSRVVGTVREQTTTKAVYRGAGAGVRDHRRVPRRVHPRHRDHAADAWDPGAARSRGRPTRRRCTSATSSSVECSASAACCCSRSAAPAPADRRSPLTRVSDADREEIHHVRRPPCSP